MQTQDKQRIVLTRLTVGIVAASLVAYFLLAFFAPKVRNMHTYQQRQEELQKRIDDTEAQEKELKDKQMRFKTDPGFVEKVAHEVGYARPDETIYQFPEESRTNNETRP